MLLQWRLQDNGGRERGHSYHMVTAESLHDWGFIEELDSLTQASRLIDRLHSNTGVRFSLHDVLGNAFIDHAKGTLPQLPQHRDLFSRNLPIIRNVDCRYVEVLDSYKSVPYVHATHVHTSHWYIHNDEPTHTKQICIKRADKNIKFFKEILSFLYFTRWCNIYFPYHRWHWCILGWMKL